MFRYWFDGNARVDRTRFAGEMIAMAVLGAVFLVAFDVEATLATSWASIAALAVLAYAQLACIARRMVSAGLVTEHLGWALVPIGLAVLGKGSLAGASSIILMVILALRPTRNA